MKNKQTKQNKTTNKKIPTPSSPFFPTFQPQSNQSQTCLGRMGILEKGRDSLCSPTANNQYVRSQPQGDMMWSLGLESGMSILIAEHKPLCCMCKNVSLVPNSVQKQITKCSL